MKDVVVVGAGIVGLLAALELRDRGIKVTLVDAGHSRPTASWAGGGILSPLFPWRYEDALNRLCVEAVTSYQRVAGRIREAGGPDPEVSVTGMVMMTDDSPDRVSKWCARFAVEAKKIRAREIESFLPEEPAWWFPHIASVRNPRLMTGLDVLLRQEGVERVQSVVEALQPEQGGVAVQTATGTLRAPRVLVAAGAWSSGLLAPMGVDLDVRPVKGQMLLFDEPQLMPASMILTEKGYLIPRRDGHILVGSTLEPEPEDMLPTREACEGLQRIAADIMPELGARRPVAQWAGLRPGTSRAAPVLDQVEDRVWLATGHYRNGLVSAPMSARLIAQMMCDEKPMLDPRPYSFSS